MLSTESLTAARRSLMAWLQALAEVRKTREVRHPYGTVLTIAAGCVSLLAIAERAGGFTQEQLATLS